MLSKAEFDVLYLLERNRHNEDLTQRLFAEELGYSLGKTNSVIKSLERKQLISIGDDSYNITHSGKSALNPYKVRNAIIMAAGMSSRFAPLSYEKPKDYWW